MKTQQHAPRINEKEASNRIQVVINRPSKTKEPETLAESVRTAASVGLANAFDDLERLIGLAEAKKTMYEIYALLRTNQEREKYRLKSEKQVYHMVFKGNPGTGKTTVARIVGRIMKELGIVSKGHLIEVERADLVGEFIGHTAQKTRDLVKKALGGVLFIDEAYSLARGGEKDFGKEAIDCLTKAMEDQKTEFVCILAGYTDEMEEFLQMNPGMPSRFPIHIEFQDYSVTELMKIADLITSEKEYRLAEPAKERLRNHLLRVKHDPFLVNFSNARYVRNVVERAIRSHAVRMVRIPEPTEEQLMTLKAEDLLFLQNMKESL